MSNLRLFPALHHADSGFYRQVPGQLRERPFDATLHGACVRLGRRSRGSDWRRQTEKTIKPPAAIFEDLVAEKPDDADSRFWLAKIQLSQWLDCSEAITWRLGNHSTSAKRALDELCGSQPNDTTLRYLAEAEHSLGEFYLQLHAHGNDHQVLLQADEYFQESKDLRVQLVERTRKAEKLSHQRDLVRSLGYLGDLYLRQGRVESAGKNYEESLAIRDIFQRDPNPEQRFQYARGLANFGELSATTVATLRVR